ncbi:MAG: 50S ribosomal protein L10 [Thermoplasmata archaeon]|nr:MAG: 50S ribosomal protein L10 [Thermoplasmata archaeon]
MAHVAKWKMNRVEDLTDVLLKNPVIGIVDIEGIPASQLQQIRKSLPLGSKFIVTRNTLLKLAFEKASKEKKNLRKLSASLDGQRGIIVADINCFRLFRVMEATKIKAPARGGEMAPDDIEIQEGDTPFKPGPIVGELQKAGFPAAIERGKVVIKKDKTMVKKGQRIPRDVAKLLARLEIYPLTVGLSLMAGFENGTVFTRDVLDVDVEGYIENIKTASSQAFNLSMFVSYPTKENIQTLLRNAHQNAFNLAFNAEIPSSESIALLLTKAHSQALSLASRLPDLKSEGERQSEEKKEDKDEVKEKKDDKKEEEKKDEGVTEGGEEKKVEDEKVASPEDTKKEEEQKEGKEKTEEKKEEPSSGE